STRHYPSWPSTTEKKRLQVGASQPPIPRSSPDPFLAHPEPQKSSAGQAISGKERTGGPSGPGLCRPQTGRLCSCSAPAVGAPHRPRLGRVPTALLGKLQTCTASA
ncbi:conserved c2h2 zinc finger protein, partial [Nannochloropsis gaditana CCMP526]|uniref:conserved c2h2 zinc finger protein n=1 Tax=Nannochloropsis gaditana (strain CCMP526) TaxID=1093141 RepID=UPI00029F54DD